MARKEVLNHTTEASLSMEQDHHEVAAKLKAALQMVAETNGAKEALEKGVVMLRTGYDEAERQLRIAREEAALANSKNEQLEPRCAKLQARLEEEIEAKRLALAKKASLDQGHHDLSEERAQLRRKVEALEKDLARKTDETASLHHEVRNLGSAVQHFEQKADSLGTEAEALQSSSKQLQEQNLQLSSQVMSLTESAQYAESRAASLNEELQTFRKTLRTEQQARRSLQQQVEELRDLATAGTQVMQSEAKIQVENLEGHIATVTEQREKALADCKALDGDYTVKFNVQRAKLQEFRERARKVMDDKDKEIRSLLDKIKELQESIESGRPGERKIFEIANKQAENDNRCQQLQDSIHNLKEQVNQKNSRIDQLRQQEASLKAQVRDLQGSSQRASTDVEYIKNVVVKYMELHCIDNADPRQLQLVPLIENLLEFTPEDVRKVRHAHGTA